MDSNLNKVPAESYLAHENLSRDSPFSYTCNRCSRCCHSFAIRVNPYEIARLSRNRKLSTTDFIDKFTDRSGEVLKRTDKDACVFLGSNGCEVHPDRPLVCRLYPLGRHTDGRGREWFHTIKPKPGSLGVYSETSPGTVQDYLDKQGAGTFIEAVDSYITAISQVVREQSVELLSEQIQAPEESLNQYPELLNMDIAVRQYCETNNLPFPESPDAKLELHLQLLKESARVVSESNG